MSRHQNIKPRVFAILGIGLACFVLFLLLLPNLEMARSEARIAQAYRDVRQISEAHRRASSPDLLTTDAIPDTDPWGKPYRLVRLNEGEARALSSGPNMASPEVGVDGDDIYSDMPVSPMAPIWAEKNRQILIAFGVSGGLWLLLSAVYVRVRRGAPHWPPTGHGRREEAAGQLVALFDNPRFRDEYGILTDDVDGALDGLSTQFGWKGVTAGLIHILEQEALHHYWNDAAATLFACQCDKHLRLPCAPSYLIALLYDCLRCHPNLGVPEENNDNENLVWSIVHPLAGVGYMSDYDPRQDPEVQKHVIAR
jgi:hypothetical protein